MFVLHGWCGVILYIKCTEGIYLLGHCRYSISEINFSEGIGDKKLQTDPKYSSLIHLEAPTFKEINE